MERCSPASLRRGRRGRSQRRSRSGARRFRSSAPPAGSCSVLTTPMCGQTPLTLSRSTWTATKRIFAWRWRPSRALCRDRLLEEALANQGVLLEDEPLAEWAVHPRERLEWTRQEARLALARDRARGLGCSGRRGGAGLGGVPVPRPDVRGGRLRTHAVVRGANEVGPCRSHLQRVSASSWTTGLTGFASPRGGARRQQSFDYVALRRRRLLGPQPVRPGPRAASRDLSLRRTEWPAGSRLITGPRGPERTRRQRAGRSGRPRRGLRWHRHRGFRGGPGGPVRGTGRARR